MKLLQRVLLMWARREFGEREVDHNIPQRGLRAGEEMIELCQAVGVPKELMLICVNRVYDKPIGSVQQEIGGVMIGLLVLAEVLKLDVEYCAFAETERVLSKPSGYFTPRNRAKNALGMHVGSQWHNGVGCLCVVGCSVNGNCPLHGDSK